MACSKAIYTPKSTLTHGNCLSQILPLLASFLHKCTTPVFHHVSSILENRYDASSLAPSHGPPATPSGGLHPTWISNPLLLPSLPHTPLSILLHASTQLSPGFSMTHFKSILHPHFSLKIQTSSNHLPALNLHQLSLHTEQDRNSLVLH